MKKVIIGISLLIAGVLLYSPMENSSFAKDIKSDAETVKVETTTEKTQSLNQAEDKTTQNETLKEQIKAETTSKEEPKVEENKNETTEAVIDENKDQKEDTVLTKSQAEEILDKYIREVEQSDFTYTYQGDENIFEAIREKGIRGYVFLPNLETDMAYLVDKDNGNIYFFHPSGYFELLQ